VMLRLVSSFVRLYHAQLTTECEVRCTAPLLVQPDSKAQTVLFQLHSRSRHAQDWRHPALEGPT